MVDMSLVVLSMEMVAPTVRLPDLLLLRLLDQLRLERKHEHDEFDDSLE